MLEAADEIFTFNDDVAHRAMILIAQARAALVVQQMKRGVFGFSRGMNPDGDRH